MNSSLLKELRKKKKVPRREVAIATGLTENTIYSMESGETTNPRLETLKAIADYYDVLINDLVKEQ